MEKSFDAGVLLAETDAARQEDNRGRKFETTEIGLQGIRIGFQCNGHDCSDSRRDLTLSIGQNAGLMFTLILFEPEIPPNTGNIIRLCANTGTKLHLVKPLGFELDERRLRRAGLDYREFVEIEVHECFDDCLAALHEPTLYALSTRGVTRHDAPSFRIGDAFLLGPETRGIPQEILDNLPQEQRLRLPMLPENRSLNLANTAAIVVYEAWRQHDFQGGS